MRWFAQVPWGAPINEIERAEVPVGLLCHTPDCGKEIEADDRGVLLPFLGAQDDQVWPQVTRRFDRPRHGEKREFEVEVGYHIDCFLKSILGTAPRALVTRKAE